MNPCPHGNDHSIVMSEKKTRVSARVLARFARLVAHHQLAGILPVIAGKLDHINAIQE